jgi:hypothetical protein
MVLSPFRRAADRGTTDRAADAERLRPGTLLLPGFNGQGKREGLILGL